MADFDDNQIGQVAAQFGMNPDMVRQQLVSEGHNYVGGGAGGMNLGAMQPASLPPEPPSMNLGGMQATQLPPEVGAPPAAAPPTQPGRWMVNADNLAVPAELAKPASRPAGPTGARTGIRATGAGMHPPQQPGMGAGQGLGRIRQLFQQRDKELTGAYQGAAAQVAEGQQRLQDVEREAYGFQQQQLDLNAADAQTRVGLYDELDQKRAQADQLDTVARAKEENALAGRAEQVTKLQDDYRNARVRDMPTSSRIGSAFALAFSGIADSINQAVGNRSDFMKTTLGIVDQNIDRDLDEQLRQIEAKGGAADDAERSLMRMKQGIQDDRAFRSANRAAVYDQFAARLERQSAQATSETARTLAAAGATEFKLRAEQNRQASNEAAYADAQKRLRDLGDARFMTELHLAMPQKGPKDKKPTPGVTGLVQVNPEATGEDRTKAQAIHSGAAGIMSNIDALIGMARQGATLSPDQRQIARRRVGALKSQFNGVFGDGTAPNEAQLEALDDMFSNPAEMNIGNVERQFQVFKDDAINQTNAKMQSYGYAIGGGDGFEAE